MDKDSNILQIDDITRQLIQNVNNGVLDSITSKLDSLNIESKTIVDKIKNISARIDDIEKGNKQILSNTENIIVLKQQIEAFQFKLADQERILADLQIAQRKEMEMIATIIENTKKPWYKKIFGK